MTTLAEILTQLEEEAVWTMVDRGEKTHDLATKLQALIRVIRVLERQRNINVMAKEGDHISRVQALNQEVLNAYKGENGGGV